MKKAFTLAETLITLGIIGVVSMLVIPTLVNNYHQRVYIAQLQRVYNTLANAIPQVMNESRVDSLADSYLSETGGNGTFLKKYFRVIKDCGTSNAGNCFAPSYKSLDGSKSSSAKTNGYCITAESGASICLSLMSEDSNNAHGEARVLVDVNGKNAPNIGGRDLFSFSIYSDGTIGTKYDGNGADFCQSLKSNTLSAQYGTYCFDKIVDSGWKMDY